MFSNRGKPDGDSWRTKLDGEPSFLGGSHSGGKKKKEDEMRGDKSWGGKE